MKEETKKTVRELKTIVVLIVIFLFIAALIISAYNRVGMANALQTVLMQILAAGTAGSVGAFGNVFYVVIIFLSLGVTFYMFERVIILLSQIRVGGILMRANLSSIKDHYIVCGAGRVGIHAAERLKEEGKKVVVIEHDCERAEAAKDKGFIVVEGDCVDEDVLEKARIRKARGLIAATGEDQKNVFVILTSKDLNPRIKIAARVNDHKSKGEFEKAGAQIIVTPEVTGGYELAERIIK